MGPALQSTVVEHVTVITDAASVPRIPHQQMQLSKCQELLLESDSDPLSDLQALRNFARGRPLPSSCSSPSNSTPHKFADRSMTQPAVIASGCREGVALLPSIDFPVNGQLSMPEAGGMQLQAIEQRMRPAVALDPEDLGSHVECASLNISVGDRWTGETQSTLLSAVGMAKVG